MMTVGLTGGIGSGKSTVSRLFQALGVPIYDSDKEAKKLMGSSKNIRKAIKRLLGEEAYDGKKLDKRFIADAIFKDRSLLLGINAIVHPEVRSHFLKWADQQDSNYVIQETAIIFENDMQDFYDKIILVTAPEKTRIERLMLRDDSTENEIRLRMQNQWKDGKKIPLSDFVIDNIELEETLKKVRAVHGLLLDHSEN